LKKICIAGTNSLDTGQSVQAPCGVQRRIRRARDIISRTKLSTGDPDHERETNIIG
jgi:hypothetical protein